MNTFTETQQFRQWWVWIILGFIAVMMGIILLTEPTAWPHTLVMAGVTALLYFWRLDTRFDAEGVHYRVLPLTGWRTMLWANIIKATVTDYGFMGYGIRWNFGEWVYNVAGNQGVRIETSTGKRILIGTQRPDELRAFLQQNPVLS